MMYDAQQSDGAILAGKAANKGARAPAEPLERRPQPRESATHRHCPDAESGGGVTRSGADTAVRGAEAGREADRAPAPHHAGGAGGSVSRAQAGCGSGRGRSDVARVRGRAGRALLDLHGRVQRGAYRAKPVRRVEIAKPDGGIRPLGIVSLEDKIVQRAVVDNLLNPIFESEFYGFSYGFSRGVRAMTRWMRWPTCGTAQGQLDCRGGHREFFGSIDRGG